MDIITARGKVNLIAGTAVLKRLSYTGMFFSFPAIPLRG
jgi:hypothetical protein